MKILILDFGSQYTHLIKTQLMKMGFLSDVYAGDVSACEVDHDYYCGIILSGGASSVNDENISFDNNFFKLNKPILGICYGHQLIANAHGSKIKKTNHEYGKVNLNIVNEDLLFDEIPENLNVWMSHGDSVLSIPENATVLANSKYDSYSAFKIESKSIWSVQFHPEVSHTEYGDKILLNFVNKICQIPVGKKWNPKDFISQFAEEFSAKLNNDKFLLGLSGGVDSMTLAAFMRELVSKDQLVCVYVNSGLMQSETKNEVISFCNSKDIHLKIIEAEDRFFDVLKGVEDPREKGKVIGYEFIHIFDEEAEKEDIKILLQGTIWSDVIESGVTKFSSQIKPHHNVSCIPEYKKVEIFEPFRDLFKDQVRSIAEYLGLSDEIVNKKVFPGPGFAIRVDGEVTKEKVKVVRETNEIINEIINKTDVKNEIWMAFSILAKAQSLGVKGDKRVWNDYCIVVRIIESRNSMTAQFSRKAMHLLPQISQRIVDETDAGRVVYDITDKPPGTIEWQ